MIKFLILVIFFVILFSVYDWYSAKKADKKKKGDNKNGRSDR